MTPEKYLHQAYLLDQQISANIEELKRLYEMSQSISSPSLEQNNSASKSKEAPFIRTVEKINEMENTINEETSCLVELKSQIKHTINSVQDPQERMVLQYRYIERMTWEQIGKKMSAAPRTIRRWHIRALSDVVMPDNPIKI